MGRKGYGRETMLKARALWVSSSMTDQQIADQLGIKRVGTLADWRRAENWEAEREIIQRETDRRISEAVAETVSQMNSRHLKEFQLMQTKGVQALKILEPTKANEAAAMIDSGIKGERLVRGEPTAIREIRALMQSNVQILEFVVADVLKVLIEQRKVDKGLAKTFAEVFAEKVNQAPFRYVTEGSE